jgi:hypothetical protein
LYAATAASVAAAMLGSTVGVVFVELGAGLEDGAAAGLPLVQPVTTSRRTALSTHTTVKADPDVFRSTRICHLHISIEGDAHVRFFARFNGTSTDSEVRTRPYEPWTRTLDTHRRPVSCPGGVAGFWSNVD